MPYRFRLTLGTRVGHDGNPEIPLVPICQSLPHQSNHSIGDSSQYPLLKPMIRVRIIAFVRLDQTDQS